MHVKGFSRSSLNSMLHGPAPLRNLIFLICRYIEDVWQEGEPRGWAGDAISGLGHFLPHVRKRLACSWRLLTAWQKLELPARAIPLLPRLAAAIAGAVAAAGQLGAALAILVGFHCLLRTGETLGISRNDLTCSSDLSSAVLSLPVTKSGQRFGHKESVVLSDAFLIRSLKLYLSSAVGNPQLVPVSSGIFRKMLSDAVCALRLSPDDYKPYSLRRGGATAHFQAFASLDATAHRGR